MHESCHATCWNQWCYYTTSHRFIAFKIWMNEIAWSWDPCFFEYQFLDCFRCLFNYFRVPHSSKSIILLSHFWLMVVILLSHAHWCYILYWYDAPKRKVFNMQNWHICRIQLDLLWLLSSGSEAGERKKHIKRHPVTRDTIDGSEIRDSPVEVGSLSHYFQGFTHPRWCRCFFPSTVVLWHDYEMLVICEVISFGRDLDLVYFHTCFLHNDMTSIYIYPSHVYTCTYLLHSDKFPPNLWLSCHS